MSASERDIRSINFPVELYEALKHCRAGEQASRENGQEAAKQAETNREMTRMAVEAELSEITQLCRDVGFAPAEGARKLVRVSLDEHIAERLELVSEELGVDITTLLLLCLRRHFGLRLDDPRRRIELRKAAKRLARRPK